MTEPGTPVYVRQPRRWGFGEYVRTRRDGKIIVRFHWDGREHACSPDSVAELEGSLPRVLPPFASAHTPNYERRPHRPQPKDRTCRDEKYLVWVRTHPCSACSTEVGIEAHHQPREKHGAVGMKCSDMRTIPLCVRCHHRHHNVRRLDREWVEGKISGMLIKWAREVGRDE